MKKQTTDELLHKAGQEFRLTPTTTAWQAVATAIRQADRRSRMWHGAAFVSVFVGLMLWGNYVSVLLPPRSKKTSQPAAFFEKPPEMASAANHTHPLKSKFKPVLNTSLSPVHLAAGSVRACILAVAVNPGQPHRVMGQEFHKPFVSKRNNKKKNAWNIEGTIAAGIGFRHVVQLSGGVTNAGLAMQLGSPQHRPAMFLSAGAVAFVPLSRTWKAGAGLCLSRYSYHIHYPHPLKNGDGTFAGTYHNYRVEIPLLAEKIWQVPGNKTGFSLRQGLLPAITVAQQSPIEDNYTWQSDSRRTINTQLGLLFSPRLCRQMGTHLLKVGPELRYSLSNSYPNSHLVREHLWSVALSASLSLQ